MENDLLETIFEAITTGDETNLRRSLGQATIDTVLQFQRAYGESPLHLCVKIGGMSHLGAVRCLLASRLFDSTAVDGEGLTALECALKNGDDGELGEALIKADIDGLDDATACYRMLRYDSLEIFQKYLHLRQYTEEDEFRSIASALIRLNVANVKLSEALHHYTQWKLSDYGFRALSGNWTGTKDANEWKTHIDIIGDCWRVIRERHDTRLYDDADDVFLHRLQTVHNHFYLLKHKQFLAHLPMQEATFCVAIFLAIFRNPTQFADYRLTVNKCMVIEFVRMVSEQLAIVRKYLEGTERELLAIAHRAEAAGAEAKDRLIGELLAKLESSPLPNKAHVMKQLMERAATDASNKDSLMKDMLDKVKRIDKRWAEKKAEELKALDRGHRERLIEQLGNRLRHVSHPQNVVNRLMGDWRKGKPTDTIVADIVAGESFDLCHLLRGKDRRRMRKLLKCYRITKQHYSLHKIVFYCKNIESIPQPDVFRPATHVDIACMKRTIQVLGEAIKNTTNSANMPARAEDAVNSMLTALFPNINKLLREVFSHSISLKKLLQGESSYDRKMCTTFHAHMGMMRTAFQLLYVVTVADVRQAFYGQLRRCETFRELRSLVLYAGDSGDLEDRQHACYRQVTEYFEEAKAAFERVEKESIGKTALLQHLRQHLDVKREIVKELGRHFKENDGLSETEIRRACLSGDDLPSVRRLLDWKLTMNWAGSFYRKVRTSWATNHVESLTLEWMDPGLVKYNPAVIAGMLKMASSAMECSEEFEYIGYTRQLAVELNVAEGLDEEALRQLNKRLRSYYGDIFFVDNKWKVLEAFCRERKLPWNREQARLLVKRDQEVLQQLYNGRRRKLRTILEQHRLHTVEGLVTRLYTLPTRVMSSIEYLQLELCEMLLAVGYFGDNFHYLKRRIPMIQGKNYRNYLAHDQLSYNLLTDCWMEKIVINAFVFANTEVRLFGSNSHASNAFQLNVPTVSEMDRWVERQQQLLAAFQARDIARMHTIAQDGGELKARFCCSQNTTHHPATYCLLPELINPCRFDKPTVQYLDLFFAGFQDQCNNPAFQLKMALTLHDFQAIFDRTIALGNTHIPEELLDWEDLMPRVRQTKLFLHLVAAYNRAPILSKLIEHGNVRGVRELLPYFETFNSPNDRGPLGDALLYCSRSIVELLLPRSMAPHPAILLLAIILHRNDVFTHMMAKLAHIDAKTFHDLLRTTAQARNYTATVYLMENEDFRPFHADALVYSCKLAARMGERAVLQHLFERCPTPDGPTLAKTLHQAAVKNRWQCVELLLQHNAPVDVVFADNLSEENCTLLVLVKYGACRLLRKIQSVQHAPFGTIVTHPFDVAVRHGTDSKRMIRTLRTLGFDWLDSSAALHAAIRNGRTDVFETIRKLVDEQCAMVTGATVVLDHFRQALGVLQRWKMISFVEESKKAYGSSLFCAVQSKDQAMVRELLSWGRRMRTLDGGVGFLGGIAFERESTFTRFGKKANNFRLWNTRDCCEEMIVRMETCAVLGEMMIWQRFTADASWTTVTFHVLTACDEVVEASLDKLPMPLRDSVSLVENLEDFLAFANSSLSNYDIVFAEFSTKTEATRCFWQIEQISCMYDIVPSLANGAVDLTDTINYRDVRGETALHHCFPNDTLELVQLLVENGAHPLLADNSDMAPIHLSMLNSQDFAVARYLFDECIRRDLRNEKGCSVLDLDDGSGANSLLHTVAMTGRVDILQRLLEHRVDVSKVNAYGVTAAQLAVSVITYNAFPIVRMLLDYDASSINATDRRGFTLLRCAVQEGSAQLTQLVLQYAPDLFANRCGMTPLAYAVAVKHTECAKCILRYATENNIRGVTQADEDCDLVLLSLMTNDYELSKMLLEYELERTLEEVDERDLPRIRSILEGTIPERPGVPVAQLVQRYDESQKLLQELLLIVTSVTVPSG
uniref:Ankyrin repeat protein n=1 Tax=Anopheles stephensi TaxID=30069 RepID=A0A182YKM7_ANOST